MNPIRKSILDYLNSIHPYGHSAYSFDLDMAAQLGISVDELVAHRDVLKADGLIKVRKNSNPGGMEEYVLTDEGFKEANP